jgi:hypothetical protein
MADLFPAIVAAQFVLRHKNLATSTAFYVKLIQTAGVVGMRLVEETLANRRAVAEGKQSLPRCDNCRQLDRWRPAFVNGQKPGES